MQQNLEDHETEDQNLNAGHINLNRQIDLANLTKEEIASVSFELIKVVMETVGTVVYMPNVVASYDVQDDIFGVVNHVVEVLENED